MNNISKIYIINLKHRTDRWHNCVQQLNKYNITNYERFDAIRYDFKDINPIHYKNNNMKLSNNYIIGTMGCKISHYNIIKNAKKNNYNNILILEDDFLFCNNFIEKYNEIISNIEKEKIDINMLYLGFSIVRDNPYTSTSLNYLKKLSSAHTTHAYIINNNFYDIILKEILNCQCEIDVCYTMCQKKYNIYGIYPSLISQKTSYSDIMGQNVDYSDKICLNVKKSMNIYISLTSIYQKQDLLLSTLKSITEQTLLPTKCFIYLSSEPYLIDSGFENKSLNQNLVDFISKNNLFQICWCENIGPYRKLLPLLKDKWDEDCLILTMDDDIYYHKKIIEQLVSDYRKYKCCIAYRGFTPKNVDNVNLKTLTYEKGPIPCRKHLYNFANGGVGTVHHPSFYHKTGDLIFNLEYIKKLCRTSDDIWYYICRIVNNVETVLNLEYQNYLQFNMYNHDKTALCQNYNFLNNTNEKNLRKVCNKFIELNY